MLQDPLSNPRMNDSFEHCSYENPHARKIISHPSFLRIIKHR